MISRWIAWQSSGLCSPPPFLPLQDGSDAREDGDEARGVFAKVVGQPMRPFSLRDGDVSAIDIWVSNLTKGDVVLIAIVGLSAELIKKLLVSLSPLGVPSGPVAPECRALATGGTVQSSTTWTSTHASLDAAYATVPILAAE